MEVIRAADPFVDVYSFQDFREPVAHLAHWHKETGKPVLWADGAKNIKAESGNYLVTGGDWYAEVLAGLRDNPGAIGAHLCGAFIRNNVRRRGLLDPNENPDETAIPAIRAANRTTTAWMNGSAN